MNATINNPPSGNRTFEAIKSSRSKKFRSKIFISDITPIAREQKTPIKETATIEIMVAVFLFIFNSSLKYATITSNKEMDDVRAATNSKKKNKREKKYPPGIC